MMKGFIDLESYLETLQLSGKINYTEFDTCLLLYMLLSSLKFGHTDQHWLKIHIDSKLMNYYQLFDLLLQ